MHLAFLVRIMFMLKIQYVFKESSGLNTLLVIEGEINIVKVQRGWPRQNCWNDIKEWTKI